VVYAAGSVHEDITVLQELSITTIILVLLVDMEALRD
jgi:hypothetical protein